jgi:TldD protein
MPHQIDPDFTSLPLTAVADAVLERARELKVEHADVRVEQIRTADLALHDARLETSHDNDERGLAVRVVHDGTWGFAGGAVIDPADARALVDRAVEVAKVSKPVTGERIELAPEPSHGEQTWVSSYEVDPFTITEADRIALLADWSSRLLAADVVKHTDAILKQVRQNTCFADLDGTGTTQQRVRLQCQLTGLWVDETSGRFETMRTIAPPVGRGWEWMTGGYDWDGELAQLPEWLAEKAQAPSVEPGRYDLVVDP